MARTLRVSSDGDGHRPPRPGRDRRRPRRGGSGAGASRRRRLLGRRGDRRRGRGRTRVTATIESLARRIGELRAAELAVFETLGAWSMDPESPPAERVGFAAGAHRAAWRAEQLAARAPVLASLPPDE